MTATGVPPAPPVNGHPVPGVPGRPVFLPLLPVPPRAGPSSRLPRRPDPEGAPEGAAPPRRQRGALERLRPHWHAPDGDSVITASMTAVVSAVILFAAIVSYTHVHALAAAHREDPTQSHLLPLSLDGVIAEASLVLLFAARHKLKPPPLARVMLWAGIVATLGANALVALPPHWVSADADAVIGAVLSAWPAAAFIGSVELVMRLVRDVRAVAAGRATEHDVSSADDSGGGDSPDDAGEGARGAGDSPGSDSGGAAPGGSGEPGGSAGTPPKAAAGGDRKRDRAPRRPPRNSDRVTEAAARHPEWDNAAIARHLKVNIRTVQRYRPDGPAGDSQGSES